MNADYNKKDSGVYDFVQSVNAKAERFFQCGKTVAQEGRPAKSFREFCGLLQDRLLKVGFDMELAEGLACVFADSYFDGVDAGLQEAI